MVSVDVKHHVYLVTYDTLPPATAISDYAIGLEKLSANEQFFVGAEMTATL